MSFQVPPKMSRVNSGISQITQLEKAQLTKVLRQTSGTDCSIQWHTSFCSQVL